ncbi:MAG: hypothetical protein JWQ06_1029 [Mucilaginibacter sp.]|nr:hypothetical protein [Mucilaginibacter sp.]
MKLKYTYTLLTLIIALYFVPAIAQTKHTTKKAAAKTQAKKPAAKKAPAKPASKPPVNKAAPSKSDVRGLGDAAAKTTRDTTKKGGGANAKNPQDKNPGSLSEEIVVTSAYKPVLADAVKIRRNPELEDKIPFKAPLSYTTLDKRLEKNEDIKQLNSMKMPAERDSVLEPNYVKVGAGNLKTLYGEAYITNGRDEALQAGGYLKHFSQAGTINKQNESKSSIGVFGKSITDQNAFSGRIDYSYTSNYFYGYNANTLPPANFNPGHQHFSTISAEGEIAKNYKDVENDFTYALKLKGYAYSDAYHARESNVVLSGFLNQTVKQFYAGVSGSLDLSTQNDSLYSYNNSLLRVNPYLKFQGNNYKIDAGINLVDEFGFSSRFFIFPAAKLELQIIPKYVRLFLEAKGDVNKSSIRDFSAINPFIGQNIAIKNSVDRLDISAGLKGTLAPGLSFKANVYRNSINNMPLFVSNFNNTFNKFAIIYDNGTARVNGFNGELDFKPSDELDIFGQVEFKNYQMASEAKPWNLPKFKLTAGTSIKITDKVKVTGSLLVRGSTYDRVFNPTQSIVNINSFVDLSGGVEYKVNRRIFIFGKVNNILNATNQTWLYYPDYGFNIFGGAGFSF